MNIKNKKNNAIFNMVLFSIFSALILLLSLVPNIGFIRIGPVAITIIHIPVLIGIMVLPLLYSIGLGFVFGLGSLIAAYIYGATPIDLAFQNPLISILPRIIFAIVAFFILWGLNKLQKVKNGDTIIFTLVSIVTVVFMYFGGWALANTINSSNQQLKDILTPIFVGISGILIGLYYFLINKENLKVNIAIPSTIMLSTLFHTTIVLVSIAIFRVSALEGKAIKDLLNIVIGTNGFIEIIVGMLVATPIAIRLRVAFPQLTQENHETFKKKRKEEKTL